MLLSQEHGVFAALEVHHVRARRNSGIAKAVGHLGNFSLPKEYAMEHRLRDLPVDAVLDPMHLENALLAFGFLCDDIVIRLDRLLLKRTLWAGLRRPRTAGAAGSSAGSAPLGVLGILGHGGLGQRGGDDYGKGGE